MSKPVPSPTPAPESSNSRPDVLGIGNPFVDYIIKVSDSQIAQLHGGKGGMIPVDYENLKKLKEEVGSQPFISLGGSGANMVRAIASLGVSTGIIGKIGKDEAAAVVLERLQALKVVSFLAQSDTPTGQVVCLITPDNERTMRAFLGASQEMTDKDLKPEAFQGVKWVHIEGYSLLSGSLTESAMKMAKDAGAKVSFDMGSFEVVQSCKEKIIQLLPRYVDVVFGNTQEMHALTGLPPEKSCNILKDMSETVVVLMGKEGCLVGHKDTFFHQPAFPVHAIDTTGAGDLFAGGFIYGYLNGRSLEECARYGAMLGAAIVQVYGVELPPETWQSLRERMKAEG